MNTAMRTQLGNNIEQVIATDWRTASIRIKHLLMAMGVKVSDLEDVVQEVCIKIMGRRVRANHKAWLSAVTRNAMIDFYRKENRRLASLGDEYIFDDCIVGVGDDENNGEIASVQNPVKDVLEFDFKEAIERELAGLEAHQRLTMYLYSEGFLYEQIAALTGASGGTVRSRIHYGKRKLRERLAAFR
jgi:RNA polymerase sigma-70 factor (ECF subfamily)